MDEYKEGYLRMLNGVLELKHKNEIVKNTIKDLNEKDISPTQRQVNDACLRFIDGFINDLNILI